MPKDDFDPKPVAPTDPDPNETAKRMIGEVIERTEEAASADEEADPK